MSSVTRAAAPSATVLPPTPTPAGWDTAVNNVLAHGTFVNSQYGPTMGLQSIRGPVNGTHDADYMNVWGGKLADGSFFVSYVTMVSEKWQLQADGNFRIDQWLHEISRDGKNDTPTHDILIETPQGIITDIQYIREGDAEVLANTTKLLDFFGHFKPKSAASAIDSVVRDGGQRSAAQKLTPRAEAPAALAAPRPTAGVTLR